MNALACSAMPLGILSPLFQELFCKKLHLTVSGTFLHLQSEESPRLFQLYRVLSDGSASSDEKTLDKLFSGL